MTCFGAFSGKIRNLLQLVELYGNEELTMSVKCRLRGGLYGPPTGIINLMCAVCALSHFLSLRMFGQSARAELATGGYVRITLFVMPFVFG